MSQVRPWGRRLGPAFAVLAGSLALAGPAHAAVTTTSVTAAGPAFSQYQDDLTTTDTKNNITVSGTSDGTSGDQVDIRCESPSVNDLLASNVNAAGSFSATVNFKNAEGDLCAVVAVPAGTNPSDLSAFHGKRVGFGEYQTYQNTSVSPGVLDDYYVGQPQTRAYDDYDSLGSCGLCDARLYGADGTRGAHYLWYDNGGVYNTYSFGGTQHPMLTIGGRQAFAPTAARYARSGVANPPQLTVSQHVDPNTGDVTIIERNPLSFCDTGCTTFTPSGAELDRAIRQTHSGQAVRIVDTIRSTDGAPHPYSIVYDEYNQNNANQNGFAFPGASGYTVYSGEHSIPGPSTATATVKSISNATAAPSLDNPVGAMTTSPAPDTYQVTGADGFEMLFSGTIPAHAGTTIEQSFALAAGDAERAQLQGANQNAMTAPRVAITSPAADGSTVSSSSLAVAGTATDDTGVSSLTVDGAAVPVSGGHWSHTVTLSPGANTITAVATDAEGNRTSARRTVTYTPSTAGSLTLGGPLRTGVITVFVPAVCKASGAATCAGTISLRALTKSGSIPAGTRAFTLHNGSRTLPVRLNAAAHALLHKRGRMVVDATVRQGSRVVAKRRLTFHVNYVRLRAKPTVDGLTAFAPLSCASAKPVKCAGHVTVSVVTRFHGKAKRRTIGEQGYKFAGGKRLTVATRLNARGIALLSRNGKLTARLAVIRGRRTVIARRTVTFSTPKLTGTLAPRGASTQP